jgi:hypothetical protein
VSNDGARFGHVRYRPHAGFGGFRKTTQKIGKRSLAVFLRLIVCLSPDLSADNQGLKKWRPTIVSLAPVAAANRFPVLPPSKSDGGNSIDCFAAALLLILSLGTKSRACFPPTLQRFYNSSRLKPIAIVEVVIASTSRKTEVCIAGRNSKISRHRRPV